MQLYMAYNPKYIFLKLKLNVDELNALVGSALVGLVLSDAFEAQRFL